MSSLQIPASLVSEARTLRSKAAGLRKAVKAIRASAAGYTGRARDATVDKRKSLKLSAMEEEHASQMAQLVDEKRELERSAARLSDVQSQVAHAEADAADSLGVDEKLATAKQRHEAAEEAALALEESIDRLQQQVLDISSVLSQLESRRAQRQSTGAGHGGASKAPRISAGSKASASSATSGASIERLTLQAEHKRLSEELASVLAQTEAVTASNQAKDARGDAEKECQRQLAKAQRLAAEAQERSASARQKQALYAQLCQRALATGLKHSSPAAALLLALQSSGGALPNRDRSAVVAAMNAAAAAAGLGGEAFNLGSMMKARSACLGKTLKRDTASNSIVTLVPST